MLLMGIPVDFTGLEFHSQMVYKGKDSSGAKVQVGMKIRGALREGNPQQ